MQQTDRPRKVDVVILGRGELAATLALLLAERGKKVALLVEGEPFADEHLAAIYERIATFEKCYAVVGTRVRGISVIEKSILGAIAEDARYDSRIVVNLAEDERHAAFARMMRQPTAIYNGSARIVAATVTGGWQLEGTIAQANVAALAESAAAAILP